MQRWWCLSMGTLSHLRWHRVLRLQACDEASLRISSVTFELTRSHTHTHTHTHTLHTMFHCSKPADQQPRPLPLSCAAHTVCSWRRSRYNGGRCRGKGEVKGPPSVDDCSAQGKGRVSNKSRFELGAVMKRWWWCVCAGVCAGCKVGWVGGWTRQRLALCCGWHAM
jgi:hypothetical protein